MISSIESADCVILVDFSNVSFTVHYASMTSGIDVLYLMLNKMLSFVRPIINSNINTAIVFAVDHDPIHKKLLVPTYKEGRTKPEVDPRPMLREALSHTGVYFAEAENQEADDVIASLCKQYAGKKIRIISGDHDLLQLLGKGNIMMYKSTTGDLFTKADLEKKYGIAHWDKIPLYKACFGDPSDSIKPGLPRVRKKDIIPIIDACEPRLDSFMESLQKSTQSDKTRGIISSNKDAITNNYQIVALNHDLVIDITAGANDRVKFQNILNDHKIKTITLFEYRYLMRKQPDAQ